MWLMFIVKGIFDVIGGIIDIFTTTPPKGLSEMTPDEQADYHQHWDGM